MAAGAPEVEDAADGKAWVVLKGEVKVKIPAQAKLERGTLELI